MQQFELQVNGGFLKKEFGLMKPEKLLQLKVSSGRLTQDATKISFKESNKGPGHG